MFHTRNPSHWVVTFSTSYDVALSNLWGICFCLCGRHEKLWANHIFSTRLISSLYPMISLSHLKWFPVFCSENMQHREKKFLPTTEKIFSKKHRNLKKKSPPVTLKNIIFTEVKIQREILLASAALFLWKNPLFSCLSCRSSS